MTDRRYWQDYYNTHGAPEEPSQFAQFVLEEFAKDGDSLIELGCGNGRDARFLSVNGVNVLAVDQVEDEMQRLSGQYGDNAVVYEAADFTNLPPESNRYDIIYSRFTLHSITDEEQARVLAWAYEALKPGGYICIEVRGRQNGLYELGDPVEGQPHAFVYEDHYRRFLDREALDEQLRSLGFQALISVESNGFAPYKDEDDMFIRQVAQKISTKDEA